MPIRTAIWTVGSEPEPLVEARLPSEQVLEEMIVADPALLSADWMLVGRQEETGHGGRIDLLAVAPDGALVLIELKRGQTPREVIAQALDYASWVIRLQPEDINAIYGRYAAGCSLKDDFRDRFGQDLDEDALNQSHQIVIVAAHLDDSTERIVEYLSDSDVPIDVLCFQVFAHGTEQLLTRTWLLDSFRVQAGSTARAVGASEPWNGEFYCSFGRGEARSWEDAVDFGFICGGGGTFYSKTLHMLKAGDRVWVNVPGSGYVGVGRVTGPAESAATFKVRSGDGDFPILDAARRASYHADLVEDLERSEYFVPVRWLQTVPLEAAVREIGFFGNQNTVCRPTTPKWRSTITRLMDLFPNFDADEQPS